MKTPIPLASFNFCLSASLTSLDTFGAMPNAPATKRLAAEEVVSGLALYGWRKSGGIVFNSILD